VDAESSQQYSKASLLTPLLLFTLWACAGTRSVILGPASLPPTRFEGRAYHHGKF
jgi:hypothetical protein